MPLSTAELRKAIASAENSLESLILDCDNHSVLTGIGHHLIGETLLTDSRNRAFFKIIEQMKSTICQPSALYLASNLSSTSESQCRCSLAERWTAGNSAITLLGITNDIQKYHFVLSLNKVIFKELDHADGPEVDYLHLEYLARTAGVCIRKLDTTESVVRGIERLDGILGLTSWTPSG